MEASLYRWILRIDSKLPNIAILNTMTHIELAREVVHRLLKGVQEEIRRQKRVSLYFEKMDAGKKTQNKKNHTP